MHDLLKALTALQRVDSELDELLRGGRKYPDMLAELEARLGAARQSTEAIRQRLAELENQKRALEEQLAADREKVKKWEARLAEQRSAREYSALAREIDIAKKQNETTAEEIAELAKQIRQAREELEAAEAAFAQVENEVRADRTRIEAALAEISKRQAELAEQRAQAAAAVPPQMLRRYDLIHERRGNALVPVLNGACTGCHMNLPPQLHNLLRSRPRIDGCPSCGRLIYVPSAFEEQAEGQA